MRAPCFRPLLEVAALALTLAACSQSQSTNVPYFADMFFGSEVTADVPAAGEPDVATPSAADATVQDSGGPDCSCGGVECGVPAGCAKSCGSCGDGQVCQDNQCVLDPKCQCGDNECGVLPGCPNDCGACGSGQACENNFCIKSCSCAGIECGVPAGCDKSCGECGPGAVCQANTCVADPKCDCKPGMCGVPPGCLANCGACGIGQKCTNNKCVSGLDCSCGTQKCGYPASGCKASCGACGIGQTCLTGQCKVLDSKAPRKFGEPCGPTDECQPPPPGSNQFAQNQYINCLHNQCETKLCIGGVCSKKCTIAKDELNNVTSQPGADGIEDPGVPSECSNAVDGPQGKVFHCVEQNSPVQVQQGQTDQLCLPATALKPCQASSDCPQGEVCRIYSIYADFAARCGPIVHNPNGSAPATGSMACNDNPIVGTVALCENNWCTAKGCVDLCKSDADCKTAPGGCKGGKCTANLQACKTDADCPVWKCKPAVQFSDSSPTTFGACQP